MFISTIIHVLELATALLVLLLAIQIKRCYTEYSASAQALSDDRSVVRKKEDALDKQDMAATTVVGKSAAATGSAAILNDYIGEFFDSPVADIGAFRATASPSAVMAASNESSHPLSAEVEADNALPVLNEEVDGEIIMVAEEASEANETEQVMSDKVVHAMLDEAKLVCAS